MAMKPVTLMLHSILDARSTSIYRKLYTLFCGAKQYFSNSFQFSKSIWRRLFALPI
jgi:hypothetical protein